MVVSVASNKVCGDMGAEVREVGNGDSKQVQHNSISPLAREATSGKLVPPVLHAGTESPTADTTDVPIGDVNPPTPAPVLPTAPAPVSAEHTATPTTPEPTPRPTSEPTPGPVTPLTPACVASTPRSVATTTVELTPLPKPGPVTDPTAAPIGMPPVAPTSEPTPKQTESPVTNATEEPASAPVGTGSSVAAARGNLVPAERPTSSRPVIREPTPVAPADDATSQQPASINPITNLTLSPLPVISPTPTSSTAQRASTPASGTSEAPVVAPPAVPRTPQPVVQTPRPTATPEVAVPVLSPTRQPVVRTPRPTLTTPEVNVVGIDGEADGEGKMDTGIEQGIIRRVAPENAPPGGYGAESERDDSGEREMDADLGEARSVDDLLPGLVAWVQEGIELAGECMDVAMSCIGGAVKKAERWLRTVVLPRISCFFWM